MLKTTIKRYLKPQQLIKAHAAACKAHRAGKLANVAMAQGSGTLITTRHVAPRPLAPKYAMPAQAHRAVTAYTGPHAAQLGKQKR
jgi:hypothetical protein